MASPAFPRSLPEFVRMFPDSRFATARRIGDVIPFGQPIGGALGALRSQKGQES